MSNLCAYCDDAAVTTVDGEPMCQEHFADWWNENHANCECCGNEFPIADMNKVGRYEYRCEQCSFETLQDKADFDRKAAAEARYA